MCSSCRRLLSFDSVECSTGNPEDLLYIVFGIRRRRPRPAERIAPSGRGKVRACYLRRRARSVPPPPPPPQPPLPASSPRRTRKSKPVSKISGRPVDLTLRACSRCPAHRLWAMTGPVAGGDHWPFFERFLGGSRRAYAAFFGIPYEIPVLSVVGSRLPP